MSIIGSEASSGQVHMITAHFESRAAAEQAKTDIVAAGLSREAVKITDGHGTATGEKAADSRVLDTVRNAFTPTRRAKSGFIVTAHVPDDNHDKVRAILDRDGQIAAV